jgi:hypothetical protein
LAGESNGPDNDWSAAPGWALTAANLVIVLVNTAQDHDEPAAAWVQDLLIAGLVVATGCPQGDNNGTDPGVGAVARAGGEANPATADRFATALQEGILLAVPAPDSSPCNGTDTGRTLLDPALLWCFVAVYVGNVFVRNVTGLRKCVATQDMSDMSQTCHMTFFNVARHLRKSMLINVATMSSKRHVFEMSS